MKFSANRETLIRVLGHAATIAGRRSASTAMPSLAGVLLHVRGNTLVASSTDLEIAVTETAEVLGKGDGQAVAVASTLLELARRQPAGSEIAFDLDAASSTLSIRCGRFATKLVTIPADEFPQMLSGKFAATFSLPASVLADLLGRTRFATSTDETRYYLNGVYLHVVETDGQPRLRGVATDGHRLARVEVDAPDGSPGMPGVIVPRKTVAEVCKLLDGLDGNVDVSVSETRFQVVMPGVALISKLIDGSFPDYNRVIPAGEATDIIEMDRPVLLGAISRVAAIASDRVRGIKLEGSRSTLRLSINSPDQGDASEDVDGEAISYSGDGFRVGFQSRYLAEVVQETGERIRMELSDGAAGPVVFRPAQSRDAMFVLMPMRV